MRGFDITPDGKILGTVDASAFQSGGPVTNEIRVVLNWLEELKQKVPTKEVAADCRRSRLGFGLWALDSEHNP